MRILHTGDIHLDASFAGSALPPGFGNRRRQSLRDVLAAMLDRARAWPADAVLIAGDLFEHDRVSRDTVAFLRGAFEGIAPVPVFIAPGNHDPYVPRSPYATEPWPDNVHIFHRPAWDRVALEHAPLTVHGFAFDGFDLSHNPFGELAVPADGRVHVAVAHGSERGHQPPEQKSYCPFHARDAALPGLHYLALGHFHKVTRIAGDPPTVMYYAGAPEGHDFSETGPRHCLEVEIELGDGGAAVHVRPAVSSRAVYALHTIDCSGVASSQDLVGALRAIAGGAEGALIARVTLEGACPPEVQRELQAVHDAVAQGFEHLEIVDETDAPEDYDALAREQTSLGAFVYRMNEEIRDAPGPDRRETLVRAREIGVAAYRGRDLAVRGLEGGAP